MAETLKLRYRPDRFEEATVEVEFPIYRGHYVGDHTTIYTKRVSKTLAIEVSVDDSGQIESVEFDTDPMERDFSPLDYQLGRGEYAVAPERVEKLLVSAASLIASSVSETLPEDRAVIFQAVAKDEVTQHDCILHVDPARSLAVCSCGYTVSLRELNTLPRT